MLNPKQLVESQRTLLKAQLQNYKKQKTEITKTLTGINIQITTLEAQIQKYDEAVIKLEIKEK